MTNFGRVYSENRPKEIEITSSSVFVASNITPYEKEIDDEIIKGYEYDYVSYTKDEYILNLYNLNKTIKDLEDELEATKILLGVE